MLRASPQKKGVNGWIPCEEQVNWGELGSFETVTDNNLMAKETNY